MLSISEIAAGVKAGTPLEKLIPAGADPEYWQGILSRYSEAKPKPVHHKKARSSSRSRKPSKRVNYAALVVGRSMAELVERVNSERHEVAA